MHLHFTIRQKRVLHLTCFLIGGGGERGLGAIFVLFYVFSVWIESDKNSLYILYMLGGDNILFVFSVCIGVGGYSIPGSHVWHMSHTSLNHFISGYSFSS